jgi:hypothetical protein
MGTAIVVKDVNWGANSVGKVTVPEVISRRATDIYNEYIKVTGRNENKNLLSFINALVDAGFDEKISAMYYLASDANNVDQVTPCVFNPSILQLQKSGDNFNISKLGTNVPNNINSRFIDRTYANSVGITTAFIIPKASDRNLDWHGGNSEYIFSSYGYLARPNFYKNNTQVYDNSPLGGVYTISSNDDGKLIYKHRNVTYHDNYTVAKAALAQPTLFAWRVGDPPSNGIIKLYLTINSSLTDAEASELHSILMKYENLI